MQDQLIQAIQQKYNLTSQEIAEWHEFVRLIKQKITTPENVIIAQLLTKNLVRLFQFLEHKLLSYTNSPIHLAAHYGDIEIIEIMVEQNPSMINASDMDSFTPLHYAAARGHQKIVKFLINKGANLNADRNGKTPLHMATRNGHIDTIKTLITTEGIDIEAKVAKHQSTPLHIAIEYYRIAAVQLLLKAGADPTAEVNNIGFYTPLYRAAELGSLEMVNMLINGKADIENGLTTDDGFKYSPLQVAAKEGYCLVVEVLIKAKAQVNAGIDNGIYFTPLWIAAYNKHTGIAKILLEAGADSEVFLQACVSNCIVVIETLLQAGFNPKLASNLQTHFLKLSEKSTNILKEAIEIHRIISDFTKDFYNNPHSSKNSERTKIKSLNILNIISNQGDVNNDLPNNHNNKAHFAKLLEYVFAVANLSEENSSNITTALENCQLEFASSQSDSESGEVAINNCTDNSIAKDNSVCNVDQQEISLSGDESL